MTTSTRSRSGLAAAAALMALAVGLAIPAPAPAQQKAQGAELLREIEDGQRNCDELEAADFDAMGDDVMGRMVGSSRSHQSMDALMRRMMGQSGEQQMHATLGQRFAGCGAGQFPAGAAGMMNGVGGMMGMMGMMGGELEPGSDSDQDNGHGSMMGGFGDNGVGDDDDRVGVGWMIGMMLLLVGGVAGVVFLVTRTRQRPSGPADILAQRFARGEISSKEYDERRALLGGSS